MNNEDLVVHGAKSDMQHADILIALPMCGKESKEGATDWKYHRLKNPGF